MASSSNWYPVSSPYPVELRLQKELADFWAERPVKVVLTIAHLDHDELNHSVTLERLAALCQLCHLRYDAKEKYRRVMNKQFPNR